MEVAQNLLQTTELSQSVLVTADSVTANSILDIGSLEEVQLSLGCAPGEAVHTFHLKS
jgi:hypothetical protein